jgi:hypothetical protein
MLSQEMDVFDAALQKAKESMGDPHACAAAMPEILKLLSALEPSVHRRSDIAQTIVIAQFSQGVVVSNTGATITNSNVVEINFPTVGQVVGVKGIVLEGDDSEGEFLNFVAASIRINGDRFLVTNGQTEKFCPLSILNGNPQDDREWFPLENRVTPSDRWFIECTSLGGAPDATYTPLIAFLFEKDIL